MAAKTTTSSSSLLSLFAVIGVLKPVFREEMRHGARDLLVISTAVALLTLTVAFAKQIAARASSNTYPSSGELLREATKWQNLKASLVTAAAVITLYQYTEQAMGFGLSLLSLYDLPL